MGAPPQGGTRRGGAEGPAPLVRPCPKPPILSPLPLSSLFSNPLLLHYLLFSIFVFDTFLFNFHLPLTFTFILTLSRKKREKKCFMHVG